MKKISIGLFLFLTVIASCEFPKKNDGGGGGGGGDVPTTEEMNNYLNSKMTVEIPRCSSLSIDEHLVERKYPFIINSGKRQWTDDYSKYIGDQFDKPYMEDLRNTNIKDEDLDQIGCSGFKYATDEEKKKFWIVWLSSIAKPENNFDNEECLHEKDGTDSCGLLQIDFAAANRWCGLLAAEMGKVKNGKAAFTTKDMSNPEINLKCGLQMMDAQLHGGSTLGITKTPPVATMRGNANRPKIAGSLFVDNPAFYWNVLKNNNEKLEVIEWFKRHAQRQLPFCSRSHFEVVIEGQSHKFDYQGKLSSRAKIGDCKKFAGENRKICEQRKKIPQEKNIIDGTLVAHGSDLNLGEQLPTTKDESCDIVDDSARTPKIPATGTANKEENSNSSGLIQK